jgi:hypothetical protein
MVTSPEEIALAELKRHQEELGMTFADPQAPVPPSLGGALWERE